MPITPDPPFPKKQGDNIRSKDWNDAVNEIIRLDNAKLTLATGGTLAGALNINTPVTVSPVVNLRQTTPSWSTVDIYKDFRFIRTEFAGNPADGPFRQFNVGAGGVSIGYPNVPPFGIGHALYVNGNVGIGTTDPTNAKLVIGDVQSYNSGLGLIGNNANGVGLYLENTTPGGHKYALLSGGSSNTVGAGSFGIYDDSASAYRLAVDPAGQIGIGTAKPRSLLHLRKDAAAALGPVLTLMNGGGHTGAAAAIDFGGYDFGTAAPAARIQAIDDGVFSAHLTFSTKRPGALANALEERLRINSNGNVGVGVTDPGFVLDVGARSRIRDGNGSAGHWLYQGGSDRAFVGLVSETQVGFWGNAGAQWSFVMNTNNGNVGIGTTSLNRAKLEVIGSMANNTGAYGYTNLHGAGSTTATQTGIPYSVWANSRMAAAEFNAFSDERIKHVRGRSDGAADLDTLLALEVTDYTYRDVFEKGDGHHKKLVAQQVERVFPQAVSRQTEVVPDIFTRASSEDGWVELATGLKAGDRIRLISEKTDSVYEVLDAEQDRFRTEFIPEGDEVFVYGREVEDFRVLDYDAVSMLNVSATQQLKRELDGEVRALRAEVASLRESNDALGQRLRLLEGRAAAASSFAINGNGKH